MCYRCELQAHINSMKLLCAGDAILEGEVFILQQSLNIRVASEEATSVAQAIIDSPGASEDDRVRARVILQEMRGVTSHIMDLSNKMQELVKFGVTVPDVSVSDTVN